MQERLVIKNFGPIREADLRFGRFNVLIGEQATGKSTVAKLLAVCRYFSYLIESAHRVTTTFEQGLSAWGLDEAIQDSSAIAYYCEHYSFNAVNVMQTGYDPQTGEPDGQYPEFTISLEAKSKSFKNLLAELEKIKPKQKGAYDFGIVGWQIPTSFFQNEVASVLDNPLYLPAERGLQSIFSIGKSSINNISDSLFNQLAKLDGIARTFRAETEIQPLRIVYKNDNGHGFVRKQGEKQFFGLFNGASGYKSSIPIALAVKYYSETARKRKSFFIEEPELSLWPAAQIELTKFLVDRTTSYDNYVLIETHSPYVLTALNNMLLAAKIGSKREEETARLMDKKYWIDSSDVSAYRMLRDGTCKSIMEPETGLISAEELDEVSNSINQTFDQLCEVEYGE